MNTASFYLSVMLAIVMVGFLSAQQTIKDVAQLESYSIAQIIKPQSVNELSRIIKTCPKPISIAGGRFSQGGQIAAENGTVIDMRSLNMVLHMHPNKRVTVAAGITWAELQQFIDRYNLSIAVMQSYNDFTVGGTLSVNAHGRDLAWGPVIDSVESIKVLLADGQHVVANRQHNKDLFNAVIGGYGACGIITEVTLKLVDNGKLKRQVKKMDIGDYLNHFLTDVKGSATAVLHNANLYPNKLTDVVSITWHTTNECLTVKDKMRDTQSFYPVEMIQEQLVRRFDYFKKMRERVEAAQLEVDEVVWRNYEMSYSVNTLEPLLRVPTTTVLQEYFIPLDKLTEFVDALRSIAQENEVNLINVSIRYLPARAEPYMTYCPVESFALVLYINMANSQNGQAYAKNWTRKLVNAASDVGGTYYLPYQLYPTKGQFKKAYPGFKKLLKAKKKYDPDNVFSNRFLTYYGLLSIYP